MKDIRMLFERVRVRNYTRREFYLIVKYLIQNELKLVIKNKDRPSQEVLSNLLNKLAYYYYD